MRSIIRRMLKGLGILVAGFIAAWYLIPWAVELPEALFRPIAMGTIYQASDGSPLRHLLNEEEERVGVPLKFEEIPKVLVDATVAAEDKRFFGHGGVDLLAIARAARMNVDSGRVVSGASTITQQLIKVSADRTGPRTMKVKLMEALQARRLEQIWSKKEILSAYVNRISYGNQFIGCAAAIQGYFNKPVKHLTLAEASFLAAIPQSPSRLNPFRSRRAVEERQHLILERMLGLGMIDGPSFAAAKGQAVVIQRFQGGFAAPHVVELDQKLAASTLGKVVCTIDPRLQARVEQIVAQRLVGLRDKHVEHAAVVVIENATRRVLALVGSRDYFSRDGGQLNGAWTPRSPGSALKPFTYALAMENGDYPHTLVADLPVEFPTETGLYKPENYGRKFYGPVTYRQALGNSLNIAAVRVLDSVGGPKPLVELLRKCGVSTLVEDPSHYGLGLTIGNAPVRLIELTNAYATLASLGEHKPWRLRESDPEGQAVRVVDQVAAWFLADVLSDNQARAMTFGTRSVLRLPFRVAVKTGTSTSYRDNWTVGYTPEITVGVWAGNFESEPMQDVSGVTGAGPIFADVLQFMSQTRTLSWYPDPEWIVRGRIDPRTGKRVVEGGPEVRLSRAEVFHKDRLPPVVDPADYEEKTGRAILSSEYSRWIASPDNWLHGLVTTATENRYVPLRIVSPLAGTTVILDPDLPGGGKTLLLKAEPADGIEWKCDTLKLSFQPSGVFVTLEPGSHTIAAIRRGQAVRSTFNVKRAHAAP